MHALILVAQGVQDQEFWYPYYRLIEAGFGVDVVVSGKTDGLSGKYGIPIKDWQWTTDALTLDDFYDLVIIPGGWQAPEIMRQDEKILQLVSFLNDAGGIIGAICHGPQVLISAGICKYRKMTCYKGMQDDLINAGAQYIDESVVIDDNIITAPHYDDNPEWMRAIMNKMESLKTES